ncbi:hypothetical protein QYM36_006556 [Artemia franciscana]|uniref:Uncharacterized protein n=1 Tax=Artemia franciscana TaxID=6661 RepID=A0AA88I411_ARTSF|nr:hypothetical protein QYM36_006556 [Artemia franciscana]
MPTEQKQKAANLESAQKQMGLKEQLLFTSVFQVKAAQNEKKLKDVPVKQEKRVDSSVDKARCSSNESYSTFLRKQHANVSFTPAWADLDRKPVGEEDDDPLLRSVGDYLSDKTIALPKGVLGYTRMTDINKETRSEGSKIISLEFHKSEPVALVGGNHGIVTLFKCLQENAKELAES